MVEILTKYLLDSAAFHDQTKTILKFLFALIACATDMPEYISEIVPSLVIRNTSISIILIEFQNEEMWMRRYVLLFL